MDKNGEGENKILSAVIKIISYAKIQDIKYIKTIKTSLIEFKLIEVDEKVEWAKLHLEKEIRLGDDFNEAQIFDILVHIKDMDIGYYS